MKVDADYEITLSASRLGKLIESLWSIEKTSGKNVKCPEEMGCNGFEPCWSCVVQKVISHLEYEKACKEALDR